MGAPLVLPGLVDPHTHLVYAGDRALDFEARCRGESYRAIAARGGGIRTTVAATRAASSETLMALGAARLAALLACGVTTVEIKSGYGLDVATELRQLRVARALGERGPQRIVTTLLLHVPPDPHASARAAWIDTCIDELLPAAQAAGIADHVDVFCDDGAFTPSEAEALLIKARALGFPLKAHADQLSATGFARTAARLGALSLDHVEHIDAAAIAAMRENGTVAVLLPAASIFLGDRARPPVAALREAGIPMALATDLNPGSSPTTDPWLVATLACTQYGLTPAEALLGWTARAAAALGLRDGTGTLAPWAPADFLVARVPSWAHLLYGLGHAPIAQTYIGGRLVMRA